MLLRKLTRRLGQLLISLSELSDSKDALTLTGDRNVEWSWVVAHLPENPGTVLDFGCGETFLGLAAAMKGGEVTAFDREPVNMPFRLDNLRFQQGDILDFDFGEDQFDLVINCSSIEHVGLAGRYGSMNVPDGDLAAMEHLRRLLKAPHGIMILTVPVGTDAVYQSLHRIYGSQRLELLLRGYEVIKDEFWSKNPGFRAWTRVSRQEALTTQGSETFYALGLFVLRPEPRENG